MAYRSPTKGHLVSATDYSQRDPDDRVAKPVVLWQNSCLA